MTSNNVTKQSLRLLYRERCRTVLSANRQAAGIAAARLMIEADWFKQSDTIACYLPLDHEFNSSPCIQAIWAANKKCYLPVIISQEKKMLAFVRYTPESIMQTNVYGILEPTEKNQTIVLHELDLLLLPLVAFDTHGTRLGTGGGFYDKTLSTLSSAEAMPWLVGIGYALQEEKRLPTEPWDVPLDYVLTEEKIVVVDLSLRA